MYKHFSTGYLGERIARSWLTTKGFKILAYNWRIHHFYGEVDAIAVKKDTLYFVEIKTKLNKDKETCFPMVLRYKLRQRQLFNIAIMALHFPSSLDKKQFIIILIGLNKNFTKANISLVRQNAII